MPIHAESLALDKIHGSYIGGYIGDCIGGYIMGAIFERPLALKLTTNMRLFLNSRYFTRAIMLPAGLLLAALSFSLSDAAQAQLPRTGRLRAEVSGLKNTSGQVCFSLFKNGDGFPNNAEALVETQCVAANTLTAASISVSFEGLPLGTYAVSVIHDENEDGRLNTGNFGIPTEGFGFSQNPTIRMRAPDFSEAAMGVVGPDSVTQMELIYY